jgi:hypothetical protein
VLEAVEPEHLVVGEVDGTLHAPDAALHGVVRVPAAGLASDEVRDEGPAVVAEARVVLLHHLLIPVDQPRPEDVQVESRLDLLLESLLGLEVRRLEKVTCRLILFSIRQAKQKKSERGMRKAQEVSERERRGRVPCSMPEATYQTVTMPDCRTGRRA